MKGLDFSTAGIRARWDAGLNDTRKVLEKAPWEGEFDPLEGLYLHEVQALDSHSPALVSSSALGRSDVMTIASMTGFARTSGTTALYRWVWELKSVNAKGLDLRLRLPAGFIPSKPG